MIFVYKTIVKYIFMHNMIKNIFALIANSDIK